MGGKKTKTKTSFVVSFHKLKTLALKYADQNTKGTKPHSFLICLRITKKKHLCRRLGQQ